MLISLGKFIAGVGLALASLFGFHQATNSIAQPIGVFNPTGGGTYRLQSSVGGSDVTIPLSAFKEPISNIPYTMAYLNSSIEYGTLEPANTTKKEFISFTGITQNSDGSATLTGVVRGLEFSFPYTASTTLQQTHSGQSIFILSNPPQLTNQYANKSNNETVSGLWSFTTSPILNPANSTSTSQAATIGYVNSVSVSGAPLATTTIPGRLSVASSTGAALNYGSTTEAFAITSELTIANPLTVNTTRGKIPVGDLTNGQINANWIATSSNYVWGGSNTFNNTVVHNATTTFNTATTTFNVPINQTSGTTTVQRLVAEGVNIRPNSFSVLLPPIVATTTSLKIFHDASKREIMASSTVFANSLATSSVVHGHLTVAGGNNFVMAASQTTTFTLVFGTTEIASTVATAGGSGQNCGGAIDFYIYFNTPTTQRESMIFTGACTQLWANNMPAVSGTASIDTTQNQNVNVREQSSDTNNELNLSDSYVELIQTTR